MIRDIDKQTAELQSLACFLDRHITPQCTVQFVHDPLDREVKGVELWDGSRQGEGDYFWITHEKKWGTPTNSFVIHRMSKATDEPLSSNEMPDKTPFYEKIQEVLAEIDKFKFICLRGE